MIYCLVNKPELGLWFGKFPLRFCSWDSAIRHLPPTPLLIAFESDGTTHFQFCFLEEFMFKRLTSSFGDNPQIQPLVKSIKQFD